jgi:hypothetical protein
MKAVGGKLYQRLQRIRGIDDLNSPTTEEILERDKLARMVGIGKQTRIYGT